MAFYETGRETFIFKSNIFAKYQSRYHWRACLSHGYCEEEVTKFGSLIYMPPCVLQYTSFSIMFGLKCHHQVQVCNFSASKQIVLHEAVTCFPRVSVIGLCTFSTSYFSTNLSQKHLLCKLRSRYFSK